MKVFIGIFGVAVGLEIVLLSTGHYAAGLVVSLLGQISVFGMLRSLKAQDLRALNTRWRRYRDYIRHPKQF